MLTDPQAVRTRRRHPNFIFAQIGMPYFTAYIYIVIRDAFGIIIRTVIIRDAFAIT